MKKKLTLIMLFLIMFNLTGCMQALNLSDRAIVQAIGVDYIDNRYYVTLQIFAPEGAGGQTAVDPSKQNAKIIQTSGETVADAIFQAILRQGKDVYYGHNRIIVLGEHLLQYGIKDVMSFFSTNSQSRPTTNVLTSRGTAYKILSSDINQGIIPAETLQKMLINAEKEGKSSKIRLFDMAENYKSKTNSIIIPVISINENQDKDKLESDTSKEDGSGSENSQTSGVGSEMQSNDQLSSENGSSESNKGKQVQLLELSGTAILLDGKLKGYLDEQETMGIQFINSKVEEVGITSRVNDMGLLSVSVFDSKSKIIPEVINNKIKVDINISSKAGILELVMDKDKNMTLSEYSNISDSISAKIEEYCNNVLNKTLKEYNVDIFNIGNKIWKNNPSFWKDNMNRWGDIIPQIEYNVNVSTNIDRVGLEVKR